MPKRIARNPEAFAYRCLMHDAPVFGADRPTSAAAARDWSEHYLRHHGDR